MFPFRLINEGETKSESGDEGPFVEAGDGIFTGRGACRVGVHEAVEGGADCDAKAKKEGVDNSVDHPYRSSHHGFGLEFE